MSDLTRLCQLDYGIVRLADGAPAAGARAVVLMRRSGELVQAPVYADAEKTRRLSRPLTADREGRLPGFVHRRRLEIQATWRGRTFSTVDAEEQRQRQQAMQAAETAAVRARDAAVAAAADRRRRVEAHVQRVQAGREARAARLAAEAKARRVEQRLRDRERERQAAEALARAEAQAAQQAPVSLVSDPILRRSTVTVVVPDHSGNDLMTATTYDFEPEYDPNHDTDVSNFSPGGFGLDASTGLAYYDTAGATEGEEMVFGISQPDHLILVSA